MLNSNFKTILQYIYIYAKSNVMKKYWQFLCFIKKRQFIHKQKMCLKKTRQRKLNGIGKEEKIVENK